jgi:hypothetical protein
MPCGSCKNRRFGGTYRLNHQGDKNRRYVPPKRLFLQEPHSVTSQKTAFFIVITVKTSNLLLSASILWHLISASYAINRSQKFVHLCVVKEEIRQYSSEYSAPQCAPELLSSEPYDASRGQANAKRPTKQSA